MSSRVLVAGVGNIFLADDGFGVEVVRRLCDQDLPPWVQVTDFGIGGIHLAYELLEDYAAAILVDATPRGGEPGTIYVIEPEQSRGIEGSGDVPLTLAAAVTDAHAMEPGSVLSLVERIGGGRRVLVVGCEPAELDERIGLSPPVASAVDEAVRVVCSLIEHDFEDTAFGDTELAASAPPESVRSNRRET